MSGTAGKMSDLVSREWLCRALEETPRNVTVIEASREILGHQDYLQDHIATAQFFNHLTCAQPSPTIPYNVPDRKFLTEYAQSIGICKDSHIVVYDRGPLLGLDACRLWWLFKVLGHERVSVLDGGYPYYIRDSQCPVSSGEEEMLQRGDFEGDFRASLMCDFDGMKALLERGSEQIVDTRFQENFTGELEEPSDGSREAIEKMNQPMPTNMVRGHFPGSKNIPFPDLTDPDTGLMHPKDTLMQMFQTVGVDLDQPLTASCYVGYSACILALAAHVCGKEDTSVYYGSWTEWAQRMAEG